MASRTFYFYLSFNGGWNNYRILANLDYNDSCKMTIEYYVLSDYGNIHKQTIDTDHKYYISHTDNTVNVRYTYTDIYDEERISQAERKRNFVDIKENIIKANEEHIRNLQEEVNLLKTAKDCDHYWELIKLSRQRKI